MPISHNVLLLYLSLAGSAIHGIDEKPTRRIIRYACDSMYTFKQPMRPGLYQQLQLLDARIATAQTKP
jgi:hypothetical protein